jgi:hypothetical protein
MYNGSYVHRDEAHRMIDYFQQNGGKILDTAFNYHEAQDVIAESCWEGKIITKVWKPEELELSMNRLNRKKLYCVMAREPNREIISHLHGARLKGFVDKVGLSIYYPQELREDVSVLHIPANRLFDEYLPTMLLHADVIIRSVFMLGQNPKNIRALKEYDRPEINHTVDFCVGCDSLEQLKINMELFT